MTAHDHAYTWNPAPASRPKPAPVLVELPFEFSHPVGTRTILNPFRVDGITVIPATAKPGSIIRVYARGSEYSTATLDPDTAERVLGELLAAIRGA